MGTRYIIGALTAIAVVSCQKANEPDENYDPNIVRVEATVGGVFSRSNPLGDGAASTVFNTDDVVTVFADSQAALTYTFDGTVWSPGADRYLRWATPTMHFIAWYPTTASAASFTLPAEQHTDILITLADYMTFEGDVTKNGLEPIRLTLQRKTARVIVKIVGYNDEYTEAEKTVSNVVIFSGSEGYATGNVSGSEVAVKAHANTDNSVFTALVIPSKEKALDNFITLTDGKGNGLNVKGIRASEAGKSYTYELTVGKNALQVSNVTVTDWATGVVIPNGETEVSGVRL